MTRASLWEAADFKSNILFFILLLLSYFFSSFLENLNSWIYIYIFIFRDCIKFVNYRFFSLLLLLCSYNNNNKITNSCFLVLTDIQAVRDLDTKKSLLLQHLSCFVCSRLFSISCYKTHKHQLIRLNFQDRVLAVE